MESRSPIPSSPSSEATKVKEHPIPNGSPRLAAPGNPSDESTSKTEIPKSVRHWVLIPIICFAGAGTGALFYILYLLATGTVESESAWPALIIAFAGLPSVIVTRVKSITEAVKMTTS